MNKFQRWSAAYSLTAIAVVPILAQPYAYGTDMGPPGSPRPDDSEQGRSGKRLVTGPVVLLTSTASGSETFTLGANTFIPRR
jgi:hypothetical protein